MTLGKIIQTARKQTGMTQVELGVKLGVSGSMIGQWENDLRKPKAETVGRIADALGSPFMELLLADADDFAAKTRERLDALRAEDELRSKEISSAAEDKFASEVETFIASPIGKSIIVSFFELNKYGQKEAMERMIELTFLPQFSRNPVPSEWEAYVDGYLRDRYSARYPTANALEDEATSAQQEKPSDGQ